MTVVARRIKATPARSASEAWLVIVNLLAPRASAARDELLRVEGIASSLIASLAMKDAPIVAYGHGPRVRIYCLYDDDAASGDQADEGQLAACPTEGDWSLSLPAPTEDLAWASKALSSRSSRVTTRDMSDSVTDQDGEENQKTAITAIDMEAFFRP
jgi:hypothetical protein